MQPQTEMVLMFEKAGFILVRVKGHMIWHCPCGHGTITARSSSGRGRGTQNARAQIARTLRACEPMKENA